MLQWGLMQARVALLGPRAGFPILVLLLLGCYTSVAGAQAGWIAAGTPFETPWYRVEGAAPGPAVLVVGGVHGNEPAGAEAADQIRHWRLERGVLLVVPHLNRRALAADQRHTPAAARAERDLNRNFPRFDGAEPRGDLAPAVWSFVREAGPDWLLDLHEGYDFHVQNAESVGSTVITFPGEELSGAGGRMVVALNAALEPGRPRFELLARSGPVEGSLARSAHDRLGVRSMILETTRGRQPLSRRARQHRLLVHHLLAELGMVRAQHDVMLPPRSPGGEPRVAIYDGEGTSAGAPTLLERVLGPELAARRVGPGDVRSGALAQFDVVLHPGGTASGQSRALEHGGLWAVRRFVHAGGGYVGICAGSYLAAANYEWSLSLVDAAVLDRAHWKRGTGTVSIELTPRGQEILGSSAARLEVHYANGPLLGPAEHPSIPDYEPLAHYRSDMAQNGAPRGVMPGTAAIVAGTYGEGRVVSLGPHLEQTAGLEGLLLRAVRWAGSAPGLGGDPLEGRE